MSRLWIRMFVGLTFVGLTFVGLMFVGACHHEPDAVVPDDPSAQPPLPPASGTPIGFLIDDATELHLRDDQVAKLRDIDSSLAAQLEVIDSQTRAANKPAEEAATPASSGGGRHGGRHSGMGGMGGMGGGGTGAPRGGGGRHRRGGGAGSGSPSNAALVGRLGDERTTDVKDALERAFALLDPAQQTGAKKVLTDHDVDVDVTVAPPPVAPLPVAPLPVAPVPPPALPPPSQANEP
ncbi:MAG: hypothetical protein ABI467_21385 [Kofleriaceae bacterium]